jgi:transposase
VRGPALPSGTNGEHWGETVRQPIRRAKQANRKKVSAEEKVFMVIEGIRAEVMAADPCRREGIRPAIYYK